MAHSHAATGEADNQLDKVDDNLFVGSQFAAANAQAIVENGVKHIFCLASQLDIPAPEVHKVHMVDGDVESMQKVLDQCSEEIAACRKEGGVLVHCQAGISRSPSVTIAHLIKAQGLGYEEALNKVAAARPQTNPNAAFREQLKKYAEQNSSKKDE